MGMYTGLRFKGVIKPEFCEVIQKMVEEDLDWNEVAQRYPQYEYFKEYSEVSRAGFIPYGGLSYMPDEWETEPRNLENSLPTDGFLRSFDAESRIWTFQCSLKNYDQTIQQFFKLIVPQIVETSLHIEYYYEEMERSVFYELKEGEVVESEQEGILYIDNDPFGLDAL